MEKCSNNHLGLQNWKKTQSNEGHQIQPGRQKTVIDEFSGPCAQGKLGKQTAGPGAVRQTAGYKCRESVGEHHGRHQPWKCSDGSDVLPETSQTGFSCCCSGSRRPSSCTSEREQSGKAHFGSQITARFCTFTPFFVCPRTRNKRSGENLKA